METQKTSDCKQDERAAELAIANTRFIFDGSSLSIQVQDEEEPERTLSFDLNAIEEIKKPYVF